VVSAIEGRDVDTEQRLKEKRRGRGRGGEKKIKQTNKRTKKNEEERD
jgi:hypothetical protein